MAKLFIFGSTGDLVKRKVLPALQEINNLEVIALGRKDLTSEEYKREYCINCSLNINYLKIDFEKLDLCSACFDFFDKNKVNFVFIALPPKLQESILNSILRLKERGIKLKILVEKPFGHDLKSASNLANLIKKEKLEKDLFISDHYLFKSGIYDLDKADFKSMKIVSTEKLGFEKRSHYDEVGALKDMVQSHFLNIVFRLMQNPEKEFKNFAVLKYLRGQYEGYEEELGRKSGTETFVLLILKTKNKLFEFVTGKSLSEKEVFIELDRRKKIITEAKNPYILIFNDFLSGKKDKFPSLKNTLLSWKILEKLELKPKLVTYPKGIDYHELT